MQIGLHVPWRSQDFNRVNIGLMTERELNLRQELWSNCVLVYQR